MDVAVLVDVGVANPRPRVQGAVLVGRQLVSQPSLRRVNALGLPVGAGRVRVDDAIDPSVGFVITDWNMPNLSGTDLARALRGRPDGATVPILMVTARSVREDIIEAMEAGVNNYIVKPFTPQILKEKIDALMSVAAG